MAQDIDKKVLDLMKKVKAKKALIKELSKPQWTTTCSLQLPGWERLNIQVEQDIGKLGLAFGTLRMLEESLKIASRELDSRVEAKWQNYPVQDWLSDIKQRVQIIGINEEKKRLATMEAKLDTLTSPEQRRAIELEKLESELGA